tara:strand:+ start:3477 stop:3836 length:360 start_codon:yes stop_codon:yes gene_type:complete
MMSKAEYDRVEPEDFIVRVRPTQDSDGIWNGEIDVAIITQPDNPLGDEDYFQVMHFCKMLASTIPVMEVNEDFRDLVHNYVMETVDKHYEVELEDKPKVVETDGNVVTIDFSSKTEGSA